VPYPFPSSVPVHPFEEKKSVLYQFFFFEKVGNQSPKPVRSGAVTPLRPKTPVRGGLIFSLFRKPLSGVVSFVPCSKKPCPGWSHLFTNGDRDRRPGPSPVVSPVKFTWISQESHLRPVPVTWTWPAGMRVSRAPRSGQVSGQGFQETAGQVQVSGGKGVLGNPGGCLDVIRDCW
jgi:hypothetical protein